jgi:hypothetical protein
LSLSPSELLDAQLRASDLITDETSHQRAVACRDPGMTRPLYMSDQDLATMRAKFPFLEAFTDMFIRTTPPESLLKMEATTIKMRDSEQGRDADNKLAANRSALATTTKSVPAGQDNRWSLLHEGRFLPDAGCSAAKIWLRARDILGLTGAPPLGNYDMAAVGLGRFVTAKGWVELANPSSTKLSLKLFNLNNCSGKVSMTKSDSLDSYPPDFAEIGEFQLALRTLRNAAAFVSPWNFSFAALENFLVNCRFCASELAGVDKPAVILTQFVDYVLVKNAARWRDAEVFLTAGELKNTWQAFFGARPQSALQKKPTGTMLAGTKRPNTTSSNKKKRPFIDVCYNYNKGICQKQPGQCVSVSGTILRHVCDHRPDPNNLLTFCGQNHRRIDNH